MLKLSRCLTGVLLSVFGLATIITGLLLGGGPGYGQKERRDELRAGGLSTISNWITSEYATNGSLPTNEAYTLWLAANIGEMKFFPKNHPLVSEPPTYRPLGIDAYELCSTFEHETNPPREPIMAPGFTASGTPILPNEAPHFWTHTAGRTCFAISVPVSIKEQVSRQNTATSTQP